MLFHWVKPFPSVPDFFNFCLRALVQVYGYWNESSGRMRLHEMSLYGVILSIVYVSKRLVEIVEREGNSESIIWGECNTFIKIVFYVRSKHVCSFPAFYCKHIESKEASRN